MPIPPLRAVLFDAYGTLVRLVDPVEAIARQLADAGYDNPTDVVARAFRAEVAFYMANQDRGRDAPSLEALAVDAAEVLVAELSVRPPRELVVDILLRGLPYALYDDVVPTLRRIAATGLRAGVVSNWDCGLVDVLDRLGIVGRFEIVVTSAEAGVRKPDPAIFAQAAEQLALPPGAILHCGDNPELDCAAAAAAGLRSVLIDRVGGLAHAGARITTLSAVADPVG